MNHNGKSRLFDAQGKKIQTPPPPGLASVITINLAHAGQGAVMVPTNSDGIVAVRVGMPSSVVEIIATSDAQLEAFGKVLELARKKRNESAARIKLVPPEDAPPSAP